MSILKLWGLSLISVIMIIIIMFLLSPLIMIAILKSALYLKLSPETVMVLLPFVQILCLFIIFGGIIFYLDKKYGRQITKSFVLRIIILLIIFVLFSGSLFF